MISEVEENDVLELTSISKQPEGIVNPVYDEHAGDNESIELSSKGDGANNNRIKSPATNGDVKVTVDPEEYHQNGTHLPSSEPAAGDSRANGVHYTNGGTVEPVWLKGTEKLIQPGALTFGQHLAKRKIAVAVLVVVLLVAIALAAYFIYALTSKDVKPHPTSALPEARKDEKHGFRLLNGTDSGSGILQTSRNDTWMNICSSDWDKFSKICNGLGYPGQNSTFVSQRAAELNYPSISLDFDCVVGDIPDKKCSPKDIEGTVTNDCTDIIWLNCKSTSEGADPGQLVSGSSTTLSARSSAPSNTTQYTEANSTSPISSTTNVTTASSITTIQQISNTTNASETTTQVVPSTTVTAPLNIRLVGSTEANMGKLEVNYDGVWGTVCDDLWSNNDAFIICRQLNFSGVLTYHIKHPPIALTAVSTDQPVLLTNVNCSGEETNLGQCGFDLFSNSDAPTCHHNEDVVLSCIAPEPPTIPDTSSEVTTTEAVITSTSNPTTTTTPTTTTIPTTVTTLPPSTTTTALAFQNNATVYIEPYRGVRNKTSVELYTINTNSPTNAYSMSVPSTPSSFTQPATSDKTSLTASSARSTSISEVDTDTSVQSIIDKPSASVLHLSTTGQLLPDTYSSSSYPIQSQNSSPAPAYMTSFPSSTASLKLQTTARYTSQGRNDMGEGSSPHVTYTSIPAASKMPSNISPIANSKVFFFDDSVIAFIHPLEKDPQPNKGLLVVQMNGLKYVLCETGWSEETALVACRMAGYSELINKHNGRHYELYLQFEAEEDQYEVFPSKLTCTGDETSLAQCFFSTQECRITNAVWGLECGPAPTTSTVPTTVTTTIQPPTELTTTVPFIGPVTQDPKPIKEKIPIRLYGGEGANIGRLEVHFNNTWGTVCSGDGWTENNAKVVCHQLHYMGVGEREILSNRGAGPVGDDSQPIWLTDIVCGGTEEHLTQCKHELLNDGDTCNHRFDVRMSCEINGTVTTTPLPTVYVTGDVRLNPGPAAGRLEYYLNNEWGAVCDRGWDLADAKAACWQLGYSDVTAFEAGSSTDLPNIEFFISDVECLGNETRLDACQQMAVNTTDCVKKESLSWTDRNFWGVHYDERVRLVCDPNSKINTTEYERRSEPRDRIRLINGLEDINVGLLLYKKDGAWGKACKEGWGNASADLACRQLGFPGVQIYNLSLSAVNGLLPSAFSMPYHGKSINCNDNDIEMADCNDFLPTDCIKERDEVLLRCAPKPGQQTVPSDDTVRLVQGASKFEGRVEAFINGTWGRVCHQDNDWTSENMEFVCANLFGDDYYTSNELEIELLSDSASGPFVAGAFNCTVAADSATEITNFNECVYNDDPEYLDHCEHDAQVRCISS